MICKSCDNDVDFLIPIDLDFDKIYSEIACTSERTLLPPPFLDGMVYKIEICPDCIQKHAEKAQHYIYEDRSTGWYPPNPLTMSADETSKYHPDYLEKLRKLYEENGED